MLGGKNFMKLKRLDAILVDVDKCMYGPVNIPDDLETFYKILDCRCIDIVSRHIGEGNNRRRVEIICDDEFLLRAASLSAIDRTDKPALFGNILVVGPADDEGNLTSLSAKDISFVLDKIRFVIQNGNDIHPVLTHCNY
jgi:hypothetical protein